MTLQAALIILSSFFCKHQNKAIWICVFKIRTKKKTVQGEHQVSNILYSRGVKLRYTVIKIWNLGKASGQHLLIIRGQTPADRTLWDVKILWWRYMKLAVQL